MSEPLKKSTKSTRTESDEPVIDRARADVGIVAALNLEIDALLARCDRGKKYTGGDFTFRGGFLKDIRIAFVESGTGRQRAQRATQALIDAHHPEWMFSIGFAGGLTDDLKIGDIVVANRIVPATAAAGDDTAGLKIDIKMK